MVLIFSQPLLFMGILLSRSKFLLVKGIGTSFAEDKVPNNYRPPPESALENQRAYIDTEKNGKPFGSPTGNVFQRYPQDTIRMSIDSKDQIEQLLGRKQDHPLERQVDDSRLIPCGSRRLSRGFYFLQSPNYPKNYTNGYTCSNRLYPPTLGSLSMTCDRNHFNLESSPGCANDYLQVFSPKYCGTQPPPIRRDYSFLATNFRTNAEVTSSGFRCLIEAKDPGAGSAGLRCGVHRLRYGTYAFTSYKYPGNYGDYRSCGWLFYGYDRRDQVTISCSHFSLESSPGCQYDCLRVNGRLFCGTSGPVNVTRTYSNHAIFSSDFSVTSTGFNCTVTVTPVCRCGIKNGNSRVVGGQSTTSAEYPWMAGLVSRGDTRTFCGGSLINNLYVLTAAHCMRRHTTSSLQVLLGDHLIGVSDGESRHNVSQIIIHCNYASFRDGWDFALLRLSAPVTFTSRRLPVCLPTAGRDYAGITAIATGWGRLATSLPQANILQEVELPVISNTQCRARWRFIHYSHICAGGLPQGGKSVCYGDSGGPLIAFENSHYVVIGAVSFGRGCAHPNYPDGYGRVTEVLGWIRGNTRDASYCY